MKRILLALCVCLFASQAAAESFRLDNFLTSFIQKKPVVPEELGFSPDDINTWILEFLKGAKADDVFTNSTACVNATDFTVASFVYSIQGYMEDKSVQNYFNITKSVSSVTPMLKTCYDVSTGAFDKIINHFAKFQDFSQFMSMFFMNAVGKMVDFQNYWEQMEKDWEAEDYAHIAYLSGVSIRKLFDFEPFRINVGDMIKAEDADMFEKFWDFSMGFFNGTKVLATPNMTVCSDVWVEADHTFNKAIQMIKVGGETREAVFLVADIFGLVYPMNYNCYEGYDEAKAVLAKYAKIFDSPLNIFFHLVYNFGRVYDDLAKAVSSAQQGNAGQLGRSVGDVAYILFFVE